ncbi:hypothetical protein JCM11251_007931 [Rhodosporidiobolus azoricus]
MYRHFRFIGRLLTSLVLAVTSSGPRRLVLVGLGNYTHPLTRHSVGQLLLKNLAQRATLDPRFSSSGSSTLQLVKHDRKHASWTTRISLTPRFGAKRYEGKGQVELLFVLPKALMNISGPTAHAAYKDFLPAKAREKTPPPSPGPALEVFSLTPDDPAVSPPPQPRKRKPPSPPLKPIFRLLSLQDDLDLPPSKLRYQRGGGPRGHNGIRSLSSPSALDSRDFHRLWIGIGRPEERSAVAGWVLGPLGREEVNACEAGESEGEKGGEVLEKAWEEVLRVAYEED